MIWIESRIRVPRLKKTDITVVPKIIIVFFLIVFLSVWSGNTVQAEQQNTVVYYFSITGCSSCAKAEKFLNELPDHIDVVKRDTADKTDHDLFLQYCEAYAVPEEEQILPIVFAGDAYFSGSDAISARLGPFLSENVDVITPDYSNLAGDGESQQNNNFDALMLSGVFAVGLINGLNPCALSLLILFISLIASGSVLKMGLSYCLGKFITYMALGTVFYELFIRYFSSDTLILVKVLMLACFFILIILSLLDYYHAKTEQYDKIYLQLPKSIRKANNHYVTKFARKGLVPVLVGVALGALTSVGEFLCTGQIYLSTILIAVHQTSANRVTAIICFIVYCLAFILPFLIITVVFHFGNSIFGITEFIRSHLPTIKLINAGLFSLMAILIIVL